MTQDMCKDFLAGSSNRDAAARQRYKLYMKATSLEQAEEGLSRARANVHELYDRLEVRGNLLVIKAYNRLGASHGLARHLLPEPAVQVTRAANFSTCFNQLSYTFVWLGTIWLM